MEDVRRILKKATDSIAELRKTHSSTKLATDRIASIINRIGKNMEPMVTKLDKTAQDAVQNSINLVRLASIRFSVFQLTTSIAQGTD
jgi:hypothetical protein